MNNGGRSVGLGPRVLKDLKIVVVDYGSGNLRSVAKALEKADITPIISEDPQDLISSDAAILPGVGSGLAAMESLRQRGLVEPLREFVASGRPFMGVCLGLQLLMDNTEEGGAQCLGVVHGDVKHLPTAHKTPHMGWNTVTLLENHPVLKNVPREAYFYFVHSYFVEPIDDRLAIGVTEYGLEFCSVLATDRLVATQFHPEKSGALGLLIYKNFVEHAALVSAEG